MNAGVITTLTVIVINTLYLNTHHPVTITCSPSDVGFANVAGVLVRTLDPTP
jgi:hypothetical protein